MLNLNAGEVSSSVNDPKDAYTRLRASQPQQSSSSQLSTSGRRRLSKNLAAALEHGAGADARFDVDRRNAFPNPRHSRRQPSQSSSSSSQGAVSDSEGSVAAKRACGHFGAIQEEPAMYKQITGDTAQSILVLNTRNVLYDDDPGDPADISRTNCEGQLDQISRRESPHVSGNSSPLYRSEDGIALPTSDKVSSTFAPSGTTTLERATPSPEKDIKNPLAQLELFPVDENCDCGGSSILLLYR
jgi:hypothetical protein